jgi:hypothetical protein
VKAIFYEDAAPINVTVTIAEVEDPETNKHDEK